MIPLSLDPELTLRSHFPSYQSPGIHSTYSRLYIKMAPQPHQTLELIIRGAVPAICPRQRKLPAHKSPIRALLSLLSASDSPFAISIYDTRPRPISINHDHVGGCLLHYIIYPPPPTQTTHPTHPSLPQSLSFPQIESFASPPGPRQFPMTGATTSLIYTHTAPPHASPTRPTLGTNRLPSSRHALPMPSDNPLSPRRYCTRYEMLPVDETWRCAGRPPGADIVLLPPPAPPARTPACSERR
jgi:hypothetical protein